MNDSAPPPADVTLASRMMMLERQVARLRRELDRVREQVGLPAESSHDLLDWIEASRDESLAPAWQELRKEIERNRREDLQSLAAENAMEDTAA